MAPMAKRPRRSDDYDSSYYDSVPGAFTTRGPIAGPSSAAYLAPYATHAAAAAAAAAATAASNGGIGANGTIATSPLLTSHFSARSLAPATSYNHLSSGAEDNLDDMAPPRSSSNVVEGARGRGPGRGRGRGRGRPRGSTLNRATAASANANVDASSYSTDEQPPTDGRAHMSTTARTNGHPLPSAEVVEEADMDADQPSNPLIFQCRSCFRLLGDSLSFVATDTELGYLILSDVTEVVKQDTSYSTSTEPGKDIGSTFARLRCAGCNSAIGRNYRTTPRDLDDLRDCYSLEVDAICTYQLGSNYTRQLEKDGESQATRAQRSSRQSIGLNAESTEATRGRGAGLESKMERTRAFTIELSERLIKAEEDIRRYSGQVQKLLQEKKQAEAEAAKSARLPLLPPPSDQAASYAGQAEATQGERAADGPNSTSAVPELDEEIAEQTTIMSQQAEEVAAGAKLSTLRPESTSATTSATAPAQTASPSNLQPSIKQEPLSQQQQQRESVISNSPAIANDRPRRSAAAAAATGTSV